MQLTLCFRTGRFARYALTHLRSCAPCLEELGRTCLLSLPHDSRNPASSSWEWALQEAYNELLARLKALDGAAIAAAHYQAEQEDVSAALSAFLGALDGVVAAASPVAS